MSLLLVHGVGGRPRSWHHVLDALPTTLAHDVVLADVRPRAGQSVGEIARDLLERHPGAHVIVGHSLGGMLAQEAALIDRSRVHGLVLISTIAGATMRVARHNEALAADIERRGLSVIAGEFADRLLAPGRSRRDPGIKAEFVETMLECGEPAVCAGLRAIAHWDATDRLPTLTCPVEVIGGDCEPDLDRQRALAAMLGAPFELLGDTGHLGILETPIVVARTIDRLVDRLGGRPGQ